MPPNNRDMQIVICLAILSVSGVHFTGHSAVCAGQCSTRQACPVLSCPSISLSGGEINSRIWPIPVLTLAHAHCHASRPTSSFLKSPIIDPQTLPYPSRIPPLLNGDAHPKTGQKVKITSRSFPLSELPIQIQNARSK